MTQIIVDATLPIKLISLTQPVDLCDTQGRVLGRFIPKIDLSQYEPLEPQVSDEELMRRAQSKEKTYTTAEVLEHLRKL
jgi:hypothetical protein